MKMIAFLRAAIVAAAMLVSAPVLAQEKTGLKPGFALAPNARIVLMRPSIKVGAQSTGGMFEPNADWTAQARDNIGKALQSTQVRLGNRVTPYDDAAGNDPVLLGQYQNLFKTLAGSVIEFQFFPGNRLPTKVRKGKFNWSIGQEVTRLPGLAGADYALFINTEDHYGSAGRKALQIFGAMAGVGIKSGLHIGYAGLIDLKTGELVWLNADQQMGGDVRDAVGATKRVNQLLEGFPAASTAVASAR
ncbi:hypothetical protein OMW55_04650 [Sphingomonas sp. BN140010]|uniref:Uncharacterized protein n=1 Tax=Sphingomonas arvum TaxID=2992113 RepID=A0ABT3JEA4_9SPHN|nr:hypothetical protein [Sphingomonas sp. BN140010]MCW3797095.1 hypothetical protein [Sphingomonas sp. BN140010]